MATQWTKVVTFALNGERVELTNPSPQLPLIYFLREHARLPGTKLSCGEGGCGACTVVLCSRPLDHTTPPDDGSVRSDVSVHYRAVNACLFPVCALDGMAVTTIEGVGSTVTSLHAVQRRLADSNGTQCGFCTPGWIMNMYELLRTHDVTSGSSTRLTRRSVEDHFDGNLCRCTGYRPILEAFHSFADADSSVPLQLRYDDDDDALARADDSWLQTTTCDQFDDWQLVDGAASVETGCKATCTPTCANTATSCRSKYLDLEDLLARPTPTADDHDDAPLDTAANPAPPAFIVDFEPRPLKFEDTQRGLKWYRPLTLTQLFEAIEDDNNCAKDVMFIGGRTAYGVSKYYNETAPYNRPDEKPIQIELNYIAELKTVTVHEADEHAVVGAAVTLNSLLQFLLRSNSDTLQELGTLVARVANNQVRNTGTWAGNLSLCRQHPSFVSDVAVGLLGVGATLTIVDEQNEERSNVRIDEYLSKPAAEFALVVSMHLPLATVASVARLRESHRRDVFRCYKVAQRAQNAHSHVNCAIWLQLRTPADEPTVPVVTDARVVFGGVCRHPARFLLTEKQLIGRSLTAATATAAITELERDVAAIGASAAFGSQAFRSAIMKSLLYKTVVAAMDDAALADPTVASAALRLQRNVSSGTQAFKPGDGTRPVAQPVQKIGAKWQVTGEAEYVADKELSGRALYGAILYSRVALGKLRVIDAGGKVRALDGVVDILTAADIPGTNDVSGGANNEPLFVPLGGVVRCVGAPLGVVVATSQEIADHAVALCTVTYGEVPAKDRWANQTEPIVNIAMAMEAGVRGQDVPIVMGDPDVRTSLEKSPHQLSGELLLGTQKHLYMEPQVTTASVQEGGVVLIETSSQDPAFLQRNVAAILSVRLNALIVTVQRAGGGFGGKLTRCVINAAAAALAAQKLRRPVRVLNDRTADFQLVGGRENMKGTYTVGFDKDGYIHALDLALHVDCGYTVWDSVGSALMGVNWADSAYRIPSFRCQGFLYLTNTQSCTSLRAPGAPQALVLVESVLHHVATYLDLPMHWVQARNLYKEGDCTPYGQQLVDVRLQEVWDRLLVSSRVAQRAEKNALFNSNNKWKKRGIAVTPTKYGMQYSGLHDGSKVDVFAADGSVVISHGGCEIGQVRLVSNARGDTVADLVSFFLTHVIEDGTTP